MLPLGKLKQNLEFNKSLGGIIDVLKVIASIKLRQFQAGQSLYRDFLLGLEECVAMLGGEKISHPFFLARENLPRCVVGITSDEGFLGELNTLVINGMLDNQKDSNKDIIVIVGERGAGYLEDMNVSFISFPGIADELQLKAVENLQGYLIEEYLRGGFSDVRIVYPKFISLTNRRIETVRLLPCSLEVLIGETGGEKTGQQSLPVAYKELLIEPGLTDVAEGLIKLWTGFILADIFFSSKLSEFSARLMHLDGSEQELNQVNRRLSLEYFKYLHMLSDRTIREVLASRLARAN